MYIGIKRLHQRSLISIAMPRPLLGTAIIILARAMTHVSAVYL